MDFQTVLTLLGSTSALIAIIVVCGFMISLARLTYQQRDVIEAMSSSQERYLMRGAAFLFVVALIMVIGWGVVMGVLRVTLFDLLGMMALVAPVVLDEYQIRRERGLRRFFWRSLRLFIAYITLGSLFLLASVGWRVATADWTTTLGALGNGAFIVVQLIVFAIGWGLVTPGTTYEVELALDNDQALKGLWIAHSGDEFLLQMDDKIVAVRASKVVRRTFRRVLASYEPPKKRGK